MSKFVKAALIAGIALASVGSARADITYNLSNVSFFTSASGGSQVGTLTGSFTTNDARTAVISFSLEASAASAFAGYSYTPATATVTAAVIPSLLIQFDSAQSINELRLFFTSPLTASGTTLSQDFSYEHEPSGGNRFPTGSIVAATTPAASVPEPASLAALTAGLIGLAATRRRKSNHA